MVPENTSNEDTTTSQLVSLSEIPSSPLTGSRHETLVATPSTLDFGSSTTSLDCSIDSISNYEQSSGFAHSATADTYGSCFDQPTPENKTSDAVADWGELSTATAALLDPSVLKMFVDSLTRSITANEAPSILSMDDPNTQHSFHHSSTPTSSYRGAAAAPQVCARMSSNFSHRSESPQPISAFNRATTNMSVLSSQTNTESSTSSTVMLRNVPYDARQKGVLSVFTDEGFNRRFDFFYAPLDFKSKNNLGYAFVNLNSVETAKEAYLVLKNSTLSNTATIQKNQFYITIPSTNTPKNALQPDGWFTYDYKYGRIAGENKMYVQYVPFDTNNISEASYTRFKMVLPKSYAEIVKSKLK